jgi:predicted site-specific integrase-resolvase
MRGIYNSVEASEYIGISIEQLKQNMEAGAIKGFKIADKWFINSSEIEKIKEEMK